MKKIRWNEGWSFAFGSSSPLENMFGGEGEREPVTLPHDASIERERDSEEENGSGNGFFREECCYYVKNFMPDEKDREKEVFLEFEGVYQNAFVYVNGSFAGQHPYGYGNFYIDATPYLNFEHENQIKVIVKNGVPSGRWYTGSGIYRDVNLLIGDRLHFVPDQLHLRTLGLDEGLAAIEANAMLVNHGPQTRSVTLGIQLLDEDGRIAAERKMAVTLPGQGRSCSAEGGSAGIGQMNGDGRVYSQRIYVDNPRLWDPDHPNLYRCRAVIEENGRVIDEEEDSFGIRLLTLDSRHGLRINGKEYKMRGGCIHHDNGVTGTAEFAHAAEFRVKRMKEAGYNAIRSSHYPMSRRLLGACDRLGMMVMDEFADVWTSTKVDFDYGMHMSEWWEKDVKNQVNKDFNHPCVILYSIGNEIPETGNPFDVQWGKCLADLYHRLDPGRYVTNSMNLMMSLGDHLTDMLPFVLKDESMKDILDEIGENPEINTLMTKLGENTELVSESEVAGENVAEATGQVDIAGYNYAAGRYEKDLERDPNLILVGSETFPGDLDKNWALVKRLPRVLGDFSWTAWDYLGEVGIGRIGYGPEERREGAYADYPYKAAYCGDMNLLGDRRPVSYWREIVWGLRDKPYLAVQPPAHHGEEKVMSPWCVTDAVRSWNWSGFEGRPVTVELYTDADEAELYQNGQLLERKKVVGSRKCMTSFELLYEPGTLEAVVYKDGRESGRDVLTTAGRAQLTLRADAATLPADGSDIIYVEISAEDADGVLNMAERGQVTIRIEGPGLLAGFGSADPESEENYFDRTARLYEGRLRAAIRGSGEKGLIRVICFGDQFDEKTVEVQAI